MPHFADDLAAQAKARILRQWFERTRPPELIPTSESPDWQEHSEDWVIHGFEPREAIEWMDRARCFDARTAVQLKAEGLTPMDAAQPYSRPGTGEDPQTVGQLYRTGRLGVRDAVSIARRERAANRQGIADALKTPPEPHLRAYESVPTETLVNHWEKTGMRAEEIRLWMVLARCESARAATDLRAAGATPQSAALATTLGHHNRRGHHFPYMDTVAYKVSHGDMEMNQAVTLAKEPDLVLHTPAIKEALLELRDRTGYTDSDDYAQEWVRAGVRGREVLDWIRQADCHLPQAARELRHLGITREEASLAPPCPEARTFQVGEDPGRVTLGYLVSVGRMKPARALELVEAHRQSAAAAYALSAEEAASSQVPIP